MRVVFAGTPEFARQALAAVRTAGHQVSLVLTQPDRKAGRGLKLSASPVKAYALEHGIEVYQPTSLREDRALDSVREAGPDVLVVAAYGLILPQAALDIAPRGALNIHASLLPRWRGAAPIQRALLAGDIETGITIMQMDAGLDTGAMVSRTAIPIEVEDNAGVLHDRLARLGAEMIVDVLRQAQSGLLHGTPQPSEGVTYAHKIDKKEAALDWRKPSHELARAVRAFNPAPGAHTKLGPAEFKIWQAHPVEGRGGADPGRVIASEPEGILVACGRGALELTELQRAGGKRLHVSEFVRGQSLPAGVCFELPTA